MELIDKAAVVTEIENLMCTTFTNFDEGVNVAAKTLLEFINTMEVKDVDLEKELENLIEKEKAFITNNREVKYYNGDSFNHIYELEFIAKYFYELGLKAKEEDKLDKAIKLADAMYDAAQLLTTDASRLHKAMQDWWKFRNNIL